MKMMRQTGCDGVMIGRGAEGNPWIFSEICAALDGQSFVPPSIEERLSVAEGHLDAVIREKGERIGVAEAKKHMAWYINGVKGAAQARNDIMTAATADDIKKIFLCLLNKF